MLAHRRAGRQNGFLTCPSHLVIWFASKHKHDTHTGKSHAASSLLWPAKLAPATGHAHPSFPTSLSQAKPSRLARSVNWRALCFEGARFLGAQSSRVLVWEILGVCLWWIWQQQQQSAVVYLCVCWQRASKQSSITRAGWLDVRVAGARFMLSRTLNHHQHRHSM